MISTSQLLCIMLLSRLSAEMVYPSVGGYDTTSLAAAAAAEAISFVLALPLLLYSIHGRNFYCAIASKSRIAGWIIGVFAALLIAIAAARSAIYTAEFAQRSILAGMSAAVIAILIAAFAVYAAAKGAEAVARSSAMILAGAVLLSIVIVLAAVPHMRELQPTDAPVSEDMFSQVLERFCRSGEYLTFAALLPFVSHKKKGLSPASTLLVYEAAALISVLLINLFEMAVLGEFYGLAEFPFSAAAQLSDIALFKRLDGFAGAIWSAAAAMRCGIFLFSSYSIIRALSSFRKGAHHEKTSHSGGNGSHNAA